MSDALAAITVVCSALLVGLAMVLVHLKSMRATDSEVAELRQQWTEGSKGIATAQAELDKKLIIVSDRVTQIYNRGK